MKPLILFDIDYTLYNTGHFIGLVNPLITSALNITPEILSQTLKDYLNTLTKSTDFLPADFLRILANNYSFSYQKLHDIYFKPELYKSSLFPDTIPALQKLSPDFTLGIYSEGFQDFQTAKLKNCEILDFFNPDYIFIHARKAEPEILKSLPENSVIVDDKPEIINEVKVDGRLTPVWLNRTDSSLFPGIRTLHSLTDLP
jgi:FMN phosphatase YigB (HAD superfamily)